MVQIGSVTIKGPAVLAPMAGTADRAFREICASFGAAYVISEMKTGFSIGFLIYIPFLIVDMVTKSPEN